MSELLDASTWRTFRSATVLMTPISIAELKHAGITVAAHEAVAIAQQLIHDRRARTPEPPYDSPSPDNVSVGADGTVICRGCTVTLTSSEIAIFLQAVLSDGSSVPGGLRYAIARALHQVAAPAFESVDDFSVVLAHYERGARLDVLRALAAKMDPQRRIASVSRMAIDRRRAGLSSSELRRLLRDADRELFERRPIMLPPTAPRRIGSQLRIVGATILCALTAGGMSVSGPRGDGGGPALQLPPSREAAPDRRSVGTTGSGPRSDRGPKTSAPQQKKPVERRSVAPQRKVRPRKVAPTQKAPQQPRIVPPQHLAPRDRGPQDRKARSRGVIDVLRLRWLHSAIAVRDDM